MKSPLSFRVSPRIEESKSETSRSLVRQLADRNDKEKDESEEEKQQQFELAKSALTRAS